MEPTLAFRVFLLLFICLCIAGVSVATNENENENIVPGCPGFHCAGIGKSECHHSSLCNESWGGCICEDSYRGFDCDQIYCVHGKNAGGKNNCTCEEGWEGKFCEVCATDLACQKLPGGSSKSNCSKVVRPVWKKQYSCITREPGIMFLIGGKPGYVKINVNSTDQNNVIGNFQFMVDDNGDLEDMFSCKLENCSDTSDNTTMRYSCSDINCLIECEEGVGHCSKLFQAAISHLENFTHFECPKQGSNKCIVDQKNLRTFARTGLHMDCEVGECVHEKRVPFDPSGGGGGGRPDDPDDPDPDSPFPIWAIIMVSGFVLSIVLVFGFLVVWKFFNDRNKATRFAYFNDQDASTYLRSLCQPEGPITLSFMDVAYSIGNKSKPKQILKSITGIAKPGEMLAIMGPSGAGKSSFLDILGKKEKVGRIYGEILVNGRVRDRRFKRLIGFVDQEECLISTLTVRESLTYSALLRLPESVPDHVKHERVQEVMDDLKISNISESQIGGVFQRGISGGEKRRVSIGMELVTCPSILFLDEPTSGLDSYNAFVIVRCLSRLARAEQTTVIMTIHQPRSNIFHLFDNLLLLANGETVYMGPCSHVVQHYADLGCHCPPDYNPADYLIDTIVEAQMKSEVEFQIHESSALEDVSHMKPDKDEDEELLDPEHEMSQLDSDFREDAITLNSLVTGYKESTVKRAIMEDIRYLSEDESVSTPGKGRTGASYITQLLLLSKRTGSNLIRNPFLFFGHILSGGVVGVTLGILYYNSPIQTGEGADGEKGLISQFERTLGSLLIMCAFLAFGSLSSLELFHSEKVLYAHERANRFYYPSTYFISKLIFDVVPLRILPPLLMGSIAHVMIQLRGGFTHIICFLTLLILVNLVASSFCMLIGILVQRLSTANLIASLVMLFSLMLTNIFNNPNDMKPWIAWLHYCSFFNYGYEALALNELNGVEITGEVLGTKGIPIEASKILKDLGLQEENFALDFYVLAMFVVMLQISSYLSLKYIVKQHR